MPATVRRLARVTKPVANTTNNPNVEDRRNTGRRVSNSIRHEAGSVTL